MDGLNLHAFIYFITISNLSDRELPYWQKVDLVNEDGTKTVVEEIKCGTKECPTSSQETLFPATTAIMLPISQAKPGCFMGLISRGIKFMSLKPFRLKYRTIQTPILPHHDFPDLNPHGGIGANCTYGKIGPFQFAIDSGLHPKHAGNESVPRHDRIPPGELDFILLTHCHLDHPGQPPSSFPASSPGPSFPQLPQFHSDPRCFPIPSAVMKRQRSELNLPNSLYGRSDLEVFTTGWKSFPSKIHWYLKGWRIIEITAYHAGHVAGAVSFDLKYENKHTFFTGRCALHGFAPCRVLSCPAILSMYW